jgi:hypothetical protein
MRVYKLRELSGAQWDEDTCMVVLEEEHYNGHTKVCNMSTHFYSSLHFIDYD